MNKAELIERITLEGLTLGDGMVNDERIANRILALCEPYYREIAKEAVRRKRHQQALAINYQYIFRGFDIALGAIDDAMGGE